jgi:CRISPR-associated protein Csm2
VKITFWKDKKERTIDPALFSSEAEQLAKALAGDHRESRGRVNKRTQIRKFYDEVLRLENEERSLDHGWDKVLPRVHMLTAKAAYAKGRNLVSDQFLQFIKTSVAQVEEPEDLYIWSGFFEAFMGFYRLHGPSN